MEKLDRETITIAKANSHWPVTFKTDESAIAACLNYTTVSIEHIGSTAVPDLDAKPIIDILVGVELLEPIPGMIKTLATIGYVYYPEYKTWMPDRSLLIKRDSCGHRTHHLFLVECRSRVWDDYLRFRDLLIAINTLALAYPSRKYRAAKRFPNNRRLYNADKTEFINASLQRD